MPEKFTTRLRVYYEDTDAGGVVYHPNYLSFMLRARTEWIRSLPETLAEALHTVAIVVKAVSIDYAAPAYLDDELLVTSQLRIFKPVSALFFHEIYRYNTSRRLCTAEIKVGCLGRETKSICPWPHYEELRALFAI